MAHPKLTLVAALATLAGGQAAVCWAIDPPCDSPVHIGIGGSRDPWSQISGQQHGYFPTRWRPMPEAMGPTAGFLPIPLDTTRKMPTISVEGAAPAEQPR